MSTEQAGVGVSAGSKRLFTPGPLNTTSAVKAAMLLDCGSRDADFVNLCKEVRHELLKIGQVADKGYECVIMQGCGTMSIEAGIMSIVPRENAKVAVFSTGAYGRRLADISKCHDIPTVVFDQFEGNIVTPEQVQKALNEDDDITHVLMVHCETSVGTVNPVANIGAIIRSTPSTKHGPRVFFVDSMSMFGAMDLDLDAAGIDVLVSSANKCIQGVPGFGYVLLRRSILTDVCPKVKPRSVSLDLYDQWKGLESNGQFRFTPPTHSLLAFREALRETVAETVSGRAARYTALHQALVKGMSDLGFSTYMKPDMLPPNTAAYIITPFMEPEDPKFTYVEFEKRMSSKGFVVYPGKVAGHKMFRCGHIGSLAVADASLFLQAVAEVKSEMRF